MKQNVILIFDIGKTNKKYFLFNEDFSELENGYVQFPEIEDDDGDLCDDLGSITKWMLGIAEKIKADDRYAIRYINFSAYGASLVHLDKTGKPCTPLYNYLKAFPEETKNLFEKKHGSTPVWSQQTASPFLGMLNAGLQLFWLKYQQPQLFEQIHTTLFLPQYLSYVLSGVAVTEFTGVGCHTGLWDFTKNDFHQWVYEEELNALFPRVVASGTTHPSTISAAATGVGIHDSSAALVPYLHKNEQPFILLSTGTWSICLNPFNDKPLTAEELNADCLCYLQPGGQQVKASRYFLGNIFSGCEKTIAQYFGKSAGYHHTVKFDRQLSVGAANNHFVDANTGKPLQAKLKQFSNYETAYHQLVQELVQVQVRKIKLVQSSGISRIYIDGGFAKNEVFFETLNIALPDYTIKASDLALGSSLGAAMVVCGDGMKQKNNHEVGIQ